MTEGGLSCVAAGQGRSQPRQPALASQHPLHFFGAGGWTNDTDTIFSNQGQILRSHATNLMVEGETAVTTGRTDHAQSDSSHLRKIPNQSFWVAHLMVEGEAAVTTRAARARCSSSGAMLPTGTVSYVFSRVTAKPRAARPFCGRQARAGRGGGGVRGREGRGAKEGRA